MPLKLGYRLQGCYYTPQGAIRGSEVYERPTRKHDVIERSVCIQCLLRNMARLDKRFSMSFSVAIAVVIFLSVIGG